MQFVKDVGRYWRITPPAERVELLDAPEAVQYHMIVEAVAVIVALETNHVKVTNVVAYLVRDVGQPFGQPVGDLLVDFIINQRQAPMGHGIGKASETC